MTISINRRKLPRDINRDLIKKSNKIIKHEFTVNWLEDRAGSDHPLKILWSHTDVFATDQLFQLGYSLRKIKSINKTWYDRVIEEIKSGDIDKSRANILEIFVASQLHNPPDRFVELPDSPINPGYDLKVKLKNNSEIYIQVKNNSGLGNFKINEKINEVESLIISNIRSKALKVCIYKIDNIDPSDADWYHLKEQLPAIMQDTIDNTGIKKDIEGGWRIESVDISNSISYLHPSKKSYEMLLTIPYSISEKNNLLGKITKACSDLKKKQDLDTENAINIALVCIPLDASFVLCSDLAHQYFENSPEDRASGVLFYKSGAVTDINKNQNYLAHVFYLVLRDNRKKWLTANMSPLFEKIDIGIGRGAFSIDGINNIDIFSIIDTGTMKLDLKSSHVYQSGQINHLIKKTGTVKLNKHTGIKAHVFYIDRDRQEKEVAWDDIGDDRPLLL